LRYEESLVLTPQAGAFVRGGQALADGTVWGSSSRLLVEFLLEHYELYAHGMQSLISIPCEERSWYPSMDTKYILSITVASGIQSKLIGAFPDGISQLFSKPLFAL